MSNSLDQLDMAVKALSLIEIDMNRGQLIQFNFNYCLRLTRLGTAQPQLFNIKSMLSFPQPSPQRWAITQSSPGTPPPPRPPIVGLAFLPGGELRRAAGLQQLPVPLLGRVGQPQPPGGVRIGAVLTTMMK